MGVKQNQWKRRGSYGQILYRKIRKLDKRFMAEEKKGVQADPEYLALLSRMIDYSIQVQLSNISKVEEYEILQKMEESNEQRKEPVPQVVTESSQSKF